MSREHLIRSSGLIPAEILKTPLTIIGAGAIGGWSTLALAKMGFEQITVWDDDKVAIENVGIQPYGFDDIGKFKVEALQVWAKAQSGVKINFEKKRFLGIGGRKSVIVLGVDSMGSRRAIWNGLKTNATGTETLIDARMGAESALAYVMDPCATRDQETFEKTLYSDQQAVEEPCTAKATIYTAYLIGGLVAQLVKERLTRDDYTRTVLWNIREMSFQAFRKSGPG